MTCDLVFDSCLKCLLWSTVLLDDIGCCDIEGCVNGVIDPNAARYCLSFRLRLLIKENFSTWKSLNYYVDGS